MGILCVFCVYDTIGNRCFEKHRFQKSFANVLSFVVEANLSCGRAAKLRKIKKLVQDVTTVFSGHVPFTIIDF